MTDFLWFLGRSQVRGQNCHSRLLSRNRNTEAKPASKDEIIFTVAKINSFLSTLTYNNLINIKGQISKPNTNANRIELTNQKRVCNFQNVKRPIEGQASCAVNRTNHRLSVFITRVSTDKNAISVATNIDLVI